MLAAPSRVGPMSGTLQREAAPLGSALIVTTDSAAVLAAIEATLLQYPDALAIGGRMTIDITIAPDRPGDPGWPDVVAAFPDGGLVVRCGNSRAEVDHGRAHAEVVLAESLAAIPDAVRLLAEAAFTSVHVANGRLHAVHSGLVAAGGSGLLLRGPSGAGKSTLTYSCLRRGMDVVSDDWVYAAAGRPAGTFAGYPWRMLMTQEAAQRFPELRDIELVPHTSAEGWKVPVVPPAAQRHAVHDVHAVVMLDPDPHLALEPIDLDEARRRFWDASLPVEREQLRPEWVDTLLDRPTFVLRRGTSPEAAAELLEELATRCPTSC